MDNKREELTNKLRYLIEDYADVRSELLYLTINAENLKDLEELNEFKELQSKKRTIKESINNILNKLKSENFDYIMRKGVKDMSLNEVLKAENNGKKYLCKLNGVIVRNHNRTLEFLNNRLSDREELWDMPYVNFIWLESEYEEIL